MKEKKEVGTLKELERKFERKVETAFQRHDAWQLRYLRKRLKTYSLKSAIWQRLLEGGGEGKEAVKAEDAISMFEAMVRRIDTLLEILGAGEKQEG